MILNSQVNVCKVFSLSYTDNAFFMFVYFVCRQFGKSYVTFREQYLVAMVFAQNGIKIFFLLQKASRCAYINSDKCILHRQAQHITV